MTETKIHSIQDHPAIQFDVQSYDDAIKPEWFKGVYESRLAKIAGLDQFGVNRVTLDPGSYSALRHWHEGEDEFVLVLEGKLVLIDNNGEHALLPGSFVGFPAGESNAHHLVNQSDSPATYIAVGTRLPAKDTIHYPDDSLGSIRR